MSCFVPRASGAMATRFILRNRVTASSRSLVGTIPGSEALTMESVHLPVWLRMYEVPLPGPSHESTPRVVKS